MTAHYTILADYRMSKRAVLKVFNKFQKIDDSKNITHIERINVRGYTAHNTFDTIDGKDVILFMKATSFTSGIPLVISNYKTRLIKWEFNDIITKDHYGHNIKIKGTNCWPVRSKVYTLKNGKIYEESKESKELFIEVKTSKIIV